MEVVVLEEKDAADWMYRGEGAANLVLGYIGSSPAFVGKVIRSEKALRSRPQHTTATAILPFHEKLLWSDTKDIVSSTSKEIIGEQFLLNVMILLLGSEHVDAGMRVLVSREFLEADEKKILCQCPPWRVDASKISHVSDYNSLDLFSGSSDRINKAIKALFTTPQNNFRLFLNGSLIFGGLVGGTDDTNFLIGEAFEDMIKGIIQADCGLGLESFLRLVSETICRLGVFGQLLEAQ